MTTKGKKMKERQRLITDMAVAVSTSLAEERKFTYLDDEGNIVMDLPLLADALIEKGYSIAPVEFEKLTPPHTPQSVGAPGQKVWHGKGTDLEGYWKYSTYWGWSNFVATNPERYREPELGDSTQDVGALANGSVVYT